MMPIPEDFSGVQELYDVGMADNARVHDLVYAEVFGHDQYIGQFSDNSADDLRLMGRLMDLGSNAEVLDVGCGRGNIADFLARSFGWSVTGIDLSTASLDAAKKSSSRVQLMHGNLYEFPFSQAFDAIYFTGAACHFNAATMLARCRNLLRPGGKVAMLERVRLEDIPQEQWRYLTEHWKCPHVYTVEEYRRACAEAGFVVRHLVDMTQGFRVWQSRSVTVRDALRDQIVALTSETYFQLSRDLANYENQVTQQGAMGYMLLVAELPL